MNLDSSITQGSRSLKMYASRLEKLGIFTFEDFLYHIPSRYEDFSIISSIGQVQAGEIVTVQGEIKEIKNQYLSRGKIKTIQKAVISDDIGTIELVWFNQPYIIKSLPVDTKISVSGKIEISPKGKSIKSPTFEVLFNELAPIHTGRLVPIYPETKGISSKWLRRQIHNILTESDQILNEYLPIELIKNNNFMDFKSAIKQIHFPDDLELAENARVRLGFDELLLMQIAANKRRGEWEMQNIIKPLNIEKYQKNIDKFISSLPFILTSSQIKAIEEILKDLESKKPMNRLLQGDVGSGKTIVSAIGMYLAHLNGFQSVLVAPTEILAQQHFQTLSKFLNPLGVKIELVTGSKRIKNQESGIRNKQKRNHDSSFIIHNSKFDILVGTHAVMSEKIKFENLGFIVIDEQQRFGVEQRGIIRKKGTNPHLLTMTATPIPRTVALTMYGDLDLSYLTEMPKNRKVVKTWLVPLEKREAAYSWIEKQLKETNSQAFIICPFIEDSESMQTIKAAKSEFEHLKNKVFPNLKLGLLHGKLKSKEKEETLIKFKKGDFDILVATPVVEVGIDIPNATIIIIESSERFGLAQLHQLRGRVGRSDKQSYCLLFTDSKTSIQSPRLKGMETLHSGAELAELDLKLRGAGNIYGTAQHGIPKLKAANFSDTILIQKAKNSANAIINNLHKFPKLLKKVNNIMLNSVSPD